MMEIYIAKGGKEAGPFTKEQVESMLETGMVAREDSVWHEGLPDWIQVHRFLGVRPPVPATLAKVPQPSSKPVVFEYPPLVDGQQPYFAVSPIKLVVMSICTLRIYEIYWFYKQWNQIRITKREKVLPFLRASFSIFTCQWLFSRVKDEASSSGVSVPFNPGMLTVAYVVPSLAWLTPLPFSFLGFCSLWALVSMQRVVNKVNQRVVPDADRNERFTIANIVFIILGVALFLSVVAGEFARSLESNSGRTEPSAEAEIVEEVSHHESAMRYSRISGVYQDGGWHWDFRTNGTVEYAGRIGGMTSGFQGTYNISNGAVSVILENGKAAYFQLERNGDLISSQGERLPLIR